MCSRFILAFGFVCSLATLQAQIVTRLPYPINTERYDEVGPVLTQEGSVLYFSRVGHPDMNRTLMANGIDLSKSLSYTAYHSHLAQIYSQIAGVPITNPIQSVFNQDIWMAENPYIDRPLVSQLKYPLNNALPNAALSYWETENQLVVLNQFFPDGSMNEGLSLYDLSSPEDIPHPLHMHHFSTDNADVQASISPDGAFIILSLEQDNGFGGRDLYVSFQISEDIWSQPQLISEGINSSYEEISPFLSRDGTRLFFASNRPGSKGGMDLYVSYRMDTSWMKWSTPIPLPGEINSPSYESQPFLHPNDSLLVFSSTRHGSADLFMAPIPAVYRANRGQDQLSVHLFVRDSSSHKLVPAEAIWICGLDSMALHLPSGKYQMPLLCDKPVILSIQAPDYHPKTIHFLPPALFNPSLEECVVDVSLQAKKPNPSFVKHRSAPKNRMRNSRYSYKKSLLQENEHIKESYILQRILFYPQSDLLQETSQPALEQLANKLLSHPSYHILIEGHTDNGISDPSTPYDSAREESLLQLSLQRADAVKQQLINKGIAPERIRTAGFGSAYPLNDNSNALERRMNRRVEVLIYQ